MYAYELQTFPDLVAAAIAMAFLLYVLRWKRGHPYKVDLTVHLKRDKEEEDERSTGRKQEGTG